ncbi:uncharacterized protein TNIN_312851 [Trichonephila inaurata madagascariensis]|uniref:Uncharacterized protein n=1 Tax=Trichonephila inaurata madagascariensis TaxID=2747483 RepID=A0A8X6YPU2_9ARAC|nr:uncharacterized protein TNIN_312851 [Trichonephila inaurata madagascariensis]
MHWYLLLSYGLNFKFLAYPEVSLKSITKFHPDNRHTRKRGHMKRNCKTSEALLKNGKEGNPDMCIIVPDEDEKPPEIAYQNPPEVITMTNPYIDDLYCPRDTKPPSPYLSDYDKEEPIRRRDNVLVRLQHSLTRRKRNVDADRGGDELQTFDKKGGVSLPTSISQHQSMETMIADDPRMCSPSPLVSYLTPTRNIFTYTDFTTVPLKFK